ncbi:MAG: hypothetical protein ACXWRE_14620 [Pseudobdellovibrionaceae bacterium]
MRLSILILFLTLVVNGLAAKAAPIKDHQPDPIEISPKDINEPIYATETAEHNWSLRAGLLEGALRDVAQTEQLFFLGLSYNFLKEPLRAWQIGVSGAKDNFLHFSVGRKFYFSTPHDTRPYYKFGVGELIDSTEGLGSVLNLKKIQALAFFGWEDLLEWNQNLQLEMGVSYALIGPQLEVSLGFGF